MTAFSVIGQLSRRVGEKTQLAAFLMCMALAGLVLIRSVPPFGGFDETYHWFRTLQISRGVAFAPKLGPNDWGGAIDLHGIKYAYWFAERIAKGAAIDRASARAESEALAATAPENYTVSFPSSASFAPTPYLPASAAVFVARHLKKPPLVQVDVGRTVQLFTYVALVWATLMQLARGRLVALVVLTMPTPIHLATSFSADPVNLALSAYFVAFCLRLHADPNLRLKFGGCAGLLGLAMLLGTLKIVYSAAALFLVLIPAERFENKEAKWLLVACAVTLSVLTASAWAAIYRFIPGPYWHAGGDPKAALVFFERHPFNTSAGMFHSISDNLEYFWKDMSVRFGGSPSPYNFWAPKPFAWVELAALTALALLSGGRRSDWRVAGLCLLVAALIIGMLLLSFRITYGPPDLSAVQGLQGRYFLPAVLLVFVGIVYISPLLFPKASLALFGLILCNHVAVCTYAMVAYAKIWN